MEVFNLLLVIGIIFGSLGAAMAYLITYREWVHHYKTPKIPRKMALEAAALTFFMFLGIALLVGLFFG